jgi:type IV secretion system protein VirD4
LIASVAMAGFALFVAATMVEHGWIVLVVIFALMVGRTATQHLSAYGTARWCSGAELAAKGMLDQGSGLILGLADDHVGRLDGLRALFNLRLPANRAARRFLRACYRKQRQSLVRLNGIINVAVFAPVGSGKGVSIVIPHLLTCPDSMVVIDPKGELFQATGHARQHMGHRVIVIDPFGVVRGRDTFNPLAEIDPESDNAPDEVLSLANAIVVRTGKEEEPFWIEAAIAEIALAIGFMVCLGDPHERNLQMVRNALSDMAGRQRMIEACLRSDKWGGILARWAGQAAQLQDKTLHSVLANVHTHMRFLDTLAVMRNTVSSSFNPRELLTRRTTIYLVLPPEYLRSHSGLLRFWIGALLKTCVKGGAQEKKLVRFVLDEAAALGKLDCLADALDQYRGYGVRLLFIYQSLGQLKRSWPEGQDVTLHSNCTEVFFAVNDKDTAEYVSARLGEFTQVVSSFGKSAGGSSSHSSSDNGSNGSHSTSWNESSNYSLAVRKLLKPEEVVCLPPTVAITFAPSMRPIWTELIRYYEGVPRTQMSLFRVLLDTSCLLLCALMLAVMATAAISPQALR